MPYFQHINGREENAYLFASPLRVSVCAVETLWRLLEDGSREKRRSVEEADGGSCNRKGTEQLNKTKTRQSTEEGCI